MLEGFLDSFYFEFLCCTFELIRIEMHASSVRMQQIIALNKKGVDSTPPCLATIIVSASTVNASSSLLEVRKKNEQRENSS